MTPCKSGDVILAKVIFSDGSGIKKRPALVISSDNYHKDRNELIIAAITSNTSRDLPGDTNINQWKRAGLLCPSVITGIIQTIHKNMVDRNLGSLPDKDLQKVKTNLRQTLFL